MIYLIIILILLLCGVIDKYSFLHFSVAVIFRFWGMSLKNWLFIHIIFELLENSKVGMYVINNLLIKIGIPWPGGKEKSDTFLNSFGDNIFAILGWIVADNLHVEFY